MELLAIVGATAIAILAFYRGHYIDCVSTGRDIMITVAGTLITIGMVLIAVAALWFLERGA